MAYEFGQAIWSRLMADIQNEYGVAGLMGNLVAESDLCPYRVYGDYSTGYIDSLNYAIKVDDGVISESEFVNSGKAFGLAQWYYPTRKQGLYNMAKSKGKFIGSVEVTVDFLLQELKTDYLSTYAVLKTTSDIKQASDYVLHNFEKPEDMSESVEVQRYNFGTEIYNLYSGSQVGQQFTQRLTAPSTDNIHYLTPGVGGVNECIEISGGSVLPNCVGYAWGRAYEIMGSKPALSKGDAENWWGYSDGYSRGQTPKLGAIICWAKGNVGDDSDGSGHIAVVEEIQSNGTITTSNSAYGGTRFYTQTISPVNGVYSLSGYTFQGFIYLPITFSPNIPDVPSVRRKRKGYNFLLFNRKRFNYYG